MPRCPMCGAKMRQAGESTRRGHEWRVWQCPQCLHESMEHARECPRCHEVRLPLDVRGEGMVCQFCGHRFSD